MHFSKNNKFKIPPGALLSPLLIFRTDGILCAVSYLSGLIYNIEIKFLFAYLV